MVRPAFSSIHATEVLGGDLATVLLHACPRCTALVFGKRRAPLFSFFFFLALIYILFPVPIIFPLFYYYHTS